MKPHVVTEINTLPSQASTQQPLASGQLSWISSQATTGKCTWLPFSVTLSCKVSCVWGLTWEDPWEEGHCGDVWTPPWCIVIDTKALLPGKTAGRWEAPFSSPNQGSKQTKGNTNKHNRAPPSLRLHSLRDWRRGDIYKSLYLLLRHISLLLLQTLDTRVPSGKMFSTERKLFRIFCYL